MTKNNEIEGAAYATAEEQLNAYLKLLYCDLAPDPGNIFGKKVNEEWLQLERSARLRNLKAGLASSCDALFQYLGEQRTSDILNEFCNSDFFWTPVAGNLHEAFCLFVERRYKMEVEISDAARFIGIKIAIETGRGFEKRWGLESGKRGEWTFFVSPSIFDSHGSLSITAPIESERNEASRRIAMRLKGGSVIVNSGAKL